MKNEETKPTLKKVYVVSGDVRLVVSVKTPIDACHAALAMCRDDQQLGTVFHLDERGYRTPDTVDEETGESLPPTWTVPIEKLFSETGLDSYDDLDDDNGLEGGSKVPLVPVTPSGSSAE